ncbi:MAG: 2-oxoacid:acceptor oxidoreductase subunit alpha [Dehalococcoidia bacterium]|nr:MAG: 2-oxoacid:acceptor oxidoreductase subunit alpha [Dehalococcoidia bacterium]
MTSLTIGIAGAGGDGVVVLGSLLQKLAALQGYYSQMPRYYTAQIRGGGSAVKLMLDAERLSMPKDSLDILLCFAWNKYLELEQELSLEADTLIIYENDPPEGVVLPDKSFQVAFSQKSQEVTGAAQNKNIIALGLLNKILSLPHEQVRKAIQEDEDLRLLKKNLPAVEAGEQIFSEFSLPVLNLSPVRDALAKLVIHGNSAMARGAIHAGCRAFFGYPITPAAEIMQEMQKELSLSENIFLQTEDEIASAGMVIGASLAGVKSMTSTSGPGLDLMTEMLGLASVTEIPMVIVDVQRCGPSTGIPSKSEQSDLNQAIFCGHGDAPRVVMAPYDIEGCYRLIIESFNIANRFQTPVILLSDQWLGQTFVAVNDEFLKREYIIEEIKKPNLDEFENYQRYLLTNDFISPMSIMGEERLMYQTTGLTHNEEGAPDFDFETHQRFHEKRWQKLRPLRQRDDLIKVFGNEKVNRGIITWGSSAQVVLETVSDLQLQNEIAVCVPELIHPLPDKVERFVRSVDCLLVLEMNYSGQLYRYLRSQIELPTKTRVYTRAGGRPFSRRELAEPITGITR